MCDLEIPGWDVDNDWIITVEGTPSLQVRYARGLSFADGVRHGGHVSDPGGEHWMDSQSWTSVAAFVNAIPSIVAAPPGHMNLRPCSAHPNTAGRAPPCVALTAFPHSYGGRMANLLDGVRVVESAVLLNGDTVGMLSGDLGADVIKVEAPPAGDYLRYFLGQIVPGVSVAHAQVNRNKRSVLLDLRADADRETFWRLIDTADVFVDGNRPGVCDRLGIGPEEMRRRKPSMVYVQHTGFGADGPYANIPTHGMLMNALVGAHAVERCEDGLLRHGTFDEDGANLGGEATSVGALHAALHAVAALLRARETGKGAYIDVAGSDATAMTAWLTDSVAAQRGSNHGPIRYGGSVRRRDDWIALPVLRNGRRESCCSGASSSGSGTSGRSPPVVEDLVGRQADTSNSSVDWGDAAERRLVADVIATKPLRRMVAAGR